MACVAAVALAACGGNTSGSSGTGGGANDGGSGAAGEPGDRPQATSRKLDLLLVVDNSRSMGEKQAVLAASAKTLVSRLTNPRCVEESGVPTAAQPASADEACPSGGSREMAPVRDMHVGVISSSLGGHGADFCSPAHSYFNGTQDDRGELVARGKAATYQNRAYLVWDPRQTASPPGESSADDLAADVAALVSGVGETGCGFESTLESWYRFLIDPEPPEAVARQNDDAVLQGTNQKLLVQRSQFLRPDSAVLIVILSDENDCSIVDGGIAWLVAQGTDQETGVSFKMARATSTCEKSPNSPCCRSCNTIEPGGPPAGCGPLEADPGCLPRFHDELNDSITLRCWDQKRRFGVDFLQPIDRYVRGLTAPRVPNRSGTMVPNPLFSDLTGGAGPARDPSLVTVAGIIGVPWQDLARNPPDSAALRYMTAAELAANDRWPVILGDLARGTPPEDPFMRESIDPRSGTNPISGDPIRPPSVGVPLANAINGHEHEAVSRTDLQYACVFPLPSPQDCSANLDCDCSSINGVGNKVLCQAPDGVYGTTQYYSKAYPGLRHLDLLARLGKSSIVASICPRNLTQPQRDDYAYGPAVQAVVDRMKNVIE
jgi:hypothetical protein